MLRRTPPSLITPKYAICGEGRPGRAVLPLGELVWLLVVAAAVAVPGAAPAIEVEFGAWVPPDGTPEVVATRLDPGMPVPPATVVVAGAEFCGAGIGATAAALLPVA